MGYDKIQIPRSWKCSIMAIKRNWRVVVNGFIMFGKLAFEILNSFLFFQVIYKGFGRKQTDMGMLLFISKPGQQQQ